jgi:DNA repair exonuclease SbcCD ATPase subunit
MTLKEFAESRGIDYSTLMQWLWRHPELRQQMGKKGKNYILAPESEVYAELDKKYPMPKPIQIVQDDEARQDLAEARKKIEMLQDRLLQAGEQLRELEGTRLLLEQRNQEIEQLQAREAEARGVAEKAETARKQAEEEAADARDQAEQRKKEAREAREEADRLRTKAAEAEKAAEEAKDRADRMESAGLIARIFRSW